MFSQAQSWLMADEDEGGYVELNEEARQAAATALATALPSVGARHGAPGVLGRCSARRPAPHVLGHVGARHGAPRVLGLLAEAGVVAHGGVNVHSLGRLSTTRALTTALTQLGSATRADEDDEDGEEQ
jgi:hypothetical protein